MTMDTNVSLRTEIKTASNTSRSSNLELFRIIVMLLIIAHHYVVNSGLLDSSGPLFADPFSFKAFFVLLFGAFGKTGINCFVLITGYFMCKSHITPSKFFKLFFEILFYRIVIGLIFIIVGRQEVTISSMIEMFFPIHSISDVFTSCFLVFYLTIPFLTILVNHLNEKMHLRLLMLILVFYIILASIPHFEFHYSYVSWFICLFFIASYIRIYPKKIFDSILFWSIASLLTLVISCLSVVGLHIVNIKFDIQGIDYFLLSDSFKVLAVLTAVSWFMFFKNLKIKKSKIINIFGGATFGVLLIHANSNPMRQWLWVDLLKNVEVYNNGNIIYLHAFVSVACIFLICALIDIARKIAVEKPFFILWDKLWNALSAWFKKKEDKLFDENNNIGD